ncbi:hypothetical protein INR49_014857, partial [Caranx melampygus]
MEEGVECGGSRGTMGGGIEEVEGILVGDSLQLSVARSQGMKRPAGSRLHTNTKKGEHDSLAPARDWHGAVVPTLPLPATLEDTLVNHDREALRLAPPDDRLNTSPPPYPSRPPHPHPRPVPIMLRFLPLKLGRLYRCLKLLLVVGLFVILLMNTHNLFASFQKNELTDRRFINLNKCPACFGTSWCRKFMNGQVSFETWGRLRFLDVFNVKNVYFAQYGEPREGTRRVVLKRLGSNQELAEIDQKICKRATGRPRCDLIQAMYKTEFARINGDVRLLTPEVVEGWSDLVHCPSQRLLDRVVRRYAETKDSGSFLLKNLKDTERMQLLMTLAFNPEPLVLQAFVYRLNPVRIRQGVIWARLPSFGCPRWMEALVEKGEAKEEEERSGGVCV